MKEKLTETESRSEIQINTIQPLGKFYIELNTTKRALRNMK